MINLYEANERLFNNNGLEILDDIIISAEVERTLNGSFFANVRALKDNLCKHEKLKEERIITLYTPSGIQPFRIIDINPIDGTYIDIMVKQVVHDINKRVVKRCKVDSGNGAFTLNKFKNCLDEPIPHNLTSDITTNASFDWVRKKALNILIGDDDNSFLNKYGGELDVNGFNVSINKRIGTDRGFIAKYKKNIKGFNALYTTASLITRIIPIGFDGITLTDNDHVDSPNINNFNDIYCEVIEFKDIKYKDSPNNSEGKGYETLEEAQQALITACNDYFTNTKCDQLLFTADIDVAMLKDTVEYKDTAIFEEIQLGDDVLVDIEDSNIKTKQRMTYYKYNSLTKKYITVTLGLTIDDYFKEINDSLKDTVTKEELDNELGTIIDKAFQEVNDKIQNGGNLSYIKFLPSLLNPSEIIACDNEELDKAVYVVRINKAGLGVSTTGYNGTYQGLITEGKLALNEMTCRQFTAALIRTGMLSDVTGKTWINMDNGNFNFADKIKFDGTNLSINLNNGKTIEEEIRSNITINAQELNNKIEKITATSNNNLLKNGAFKNQLNDWMKNGEPTINLNVNYLSPSYGDMSLVIANTNEGIYQHIKTIPGQTYTVSFYAECDNLIPCHTRIGIQDSVMINLYDTPRFKYYSFTFTAWNTSHPFMVYANQENAKFFIGRIMINTGDIALPFSNNLDEIAEIQKKNSKIEQTVDTISNTLEKINGDYTSKSTFEQTVNEFNFKFENTGGENIVANSDFSGGDTFWTCVNGAILTPNANWIDNSYGRMARVTCDKRNSGITQYLKTIPGQTYTVSFYAEAEGRRPLSTQIGILDSITIDLEISPSFKRYSFTFTAWNTVHPFIAYTNNTTGTFYIGRIMVTHGSVLQEYRKRGDEIFSNNTKISGDGITVTHNNGSSVNINSRETSFWDRSGLKTIGIKGNGLEFISPTTGAWTSFLKASMSGERRGTTFSASGTGDYVSFGCSKNTDINSADWSTSSGITLNNKYNGAWWPGIHFWAMDTADKDNTFVHNHTSYIQESGNIYMNGQSILFDSHGHSSPNWIGKTNNDRLGIFGDNNVVIGTRHGTTNRSAILISEGGDYDYIQSWCPWDMHGYTLSNANVAYSVANVQSKAYTEDTVLKSYTTSTRYIYKDVQIKNNKIILSIPNVYKGCKYTICSIVKKGSGDVWVDKEFANYFIIRAESNIKVNVEIDVKDKENSIMPINKQRIRDTEEVASTDIAPISPEITR